MGRVMSQISAAENISIQIENDRWQLVYGNPPVPIVLASVDGVRYRASFGRSRRLPESGNLERQQILQVVIGWQQSDESWHLGLILNAELAATRNSRWCELASWPDPAVTVFDEVAHEAGQALARVLDVPLHVVPAQPVAPPPPPPLPALPLQLGMWTLEPVPGNNASLLQFRRESRWAFQRLMRILWYAFWALVYFALSAATLLSDLALPNAGTLLPDSRLLPMIGLATGVLLVLIIIQNLWQTSRAVTHILLDTSAQTLSAMRGKKQLWHLKGVDALSVYVTEVVKRRPGDKDTEHGELNLHLGSGKFRFVLEQGEAISSALSLREQESRKREEEVRLLTRENAQSSLQTAALYLAEGLGKLPTWYDRRVK